MITQADLDARATAAREDLNAATRGRDALYASPYAERDQIHRAEDETAAASRAYTLADVAARAAAHLDTDDSPLGILRAAAGIRIILDRLNTPTCPDRDHYTALLQQLITEHDLRGIRRRPDGTLYAHGIVPARIGNRGRFHFYAGTRADRAARRSFPIIDAMAPAPYATAATPGEAQEIVAELAAGSPLPAPGILQD